jgi:hypothetical protein
MVCMDLRNQYSMNSFFTVPVVPSAIISKNEAHSPQLKPSASSDVLCCGLVRSEVASRAIRASASCWTVISGVLKKDAVSFQTVSLNGRGLAKKRSERLQVNETLVDIISILCSIVWRDGARRCLAYLRLKSCSNTPSRPRFSRSKVRANGFGLVRTACVKRIRASLLAML